MSLQNQAAKQSKKQRGYFEVSAAEVAKLFVFEGKPIARVKFILAMVGTLLTPITLIGVLVGYVRAYIKFDYPRRKDPDLYPLSPIHRVAMLLGAVLIWCVLFLLFYIVVTFMPSDWIEHGYLIGYLVLNFGLSASVYGAYRYWRHGVRRSLIEGEKFGTARFAEEDDLLPYMGRQGIYLGGNYTLSDKGHILTCAGTRGGKGTNLIVPNLLGLGGYNGSWVVIDPKGENAAVTVRYQAKAGRNVVILNPWGLLTDTLGKGKAYNPLDILDDKSNQNLVDDAAMIAEMIIPIDKSDRDRFFSDSARAVLTGLIIHLATAYEKKDRTLVTLWGWLRMPEDQWGTLLEDMAVNDDPVCGEVVKKSATEVLRLMATGDKTWGIIFAYLLQGTDFIKSPALSNALQSGFDPYKLADGKTTVYVIIPADKLQSHARWLRLVVSTTMRSVIRKPNKNVCFLLDEFAALGYMPEVADVGLGLYAGYNITLWPVVQSLVQLNSIYHHNWENFIGNTAVRQFFNVNDNFTANYVSNAIGMTSNVQVNRAWWGTVSAKGNQRLLVTPDELRRASGNNIFTFMGNAPVTYYKKKAYYEMPAFTDNNGKRRYDDNPYYQQPNTLIL